MTGPRVLSLFSGYGGLDLAVAEVLGGRVIAHAEIDPAASRILEHRFPGVPNLGDVSVVDWPTVGPVDVICAGFPCQDVSLAGKRAGLRPDTRSGLWAQVAYAVDQLRPSLVVIENVRGLLSAGAHCDLEPCPLCLGDGEPVALRALGAVLGDLADLGYDAAWQSVRAADVGAPHGRFRVFAVAWPARDAEGVDLEGPDVGAGRRRGSGVAAGGSGRGPAATDAGGEAVGLRPGLRAGRSGGLGRGRPDDDAAPADADAPGDGRHEGRPEPARLVGGPDAALGRAVAAADAVGGRRARRAPDEVEGSGRGAAAAGCGEGGDGGAAAADADRRRRSRGAERDERSAARLAAPHGDDADGRPGPAAWGPYAAAVARWERLTRPAPPPTQPGAKGQPRLSPAFVEWMMGLPAGWVTGVPGVTRNEQLKALGNGVVPQQAAHALRVLLDVSAVAA